jgi:hypothetical protein
MKRRFLNTVAVRTAGRLVPNGAVPEMKKAQEISNLQLT